MIARDAADAILANHDLQAGGTPLTRASAVIVALHGRGADAHSILGLTDVLAQPDIAFLAPQARHRMWYPQSFIAPIAANEPSLSQSLAQIAGLLDGLEAAGIHARSIGLMGFSQGACLALESAIRRPRAYGAVLGISGGFIGPLGETRKAEGLFDHAPVFLGCSEADPHIPLSRVKETVALMRAMGASVEERIYQGFGHGVNDDEIAHMRRMLFDMVNGART